MSNVRRIHQVLESQPTIEGAGVRLRRAFGFHEVPRLDPFLLLDHFRSDDPRDYVAGFPWHPHRGIETITYMLEGQVEHGDSMGNQGVIGPGDVQWMTAGSGIIHQEMPKATPSGRNHGFQLWANLPGTHKMMEPRYRDVPHASIPEVELPGGARVRVVAGTVDGVAGPVTDIVTDPQFLDVRLPDDGCLSLPIPAGHTAFAYVVDGHGYFDATRDPFAYDERPEHWLHTTKDCRLGMHSLVIWEDGDTVEISAAAGPVHFLLVSGRPLREPVAWYGPIVMNTREELKEAFIEYGNGTFLKHRR